LKLLLLGANGQVGHELRATLPGLGDVVLASRNGTLDDGLPCEMGDLGDTDNLRALLERTRPDVVVNAAAYTAVDVAEDEEAIATRINADAPAELGAWAATNGVLVVHFSTDYVFDGRAHSPYLEESDTHPLNAYGRSKLAGEECLRKTMVDHMILRTAWVYAAHGNNFLRTMLRVAAGRDTLSVVADQAGAPTSARSIAIATATAIRQWADSKANERTALVGTYHLVASGTTSWHGFALAIFDAAVKHGILAKAPLVLPITTAEFPTRASRPAYSVLDNSRFQATFHTSLPSWQVALDEVIIEIANDIAVIGQPPC
jgi:dTDP-4-dehydrorhamnose reductase